MKTKVLHIITGLSTGGAETMLLRLLSQMDAQRFDSEVISLSSIGPIGERIRALGIPVRALGICGTLSGAFRTIRLGREIRAIRPNLVQTWMYHSDLLGGLASKRFRNLPVLWNIRAAALPPGAIKRSTIWVVKACAALSRSVPQKIVINSEAGLNEHVRMGYDPSKFITIPNGFDLTLFGADPQSRSRIREELGIGEDEWLIGKVARFDPYKDLENLVRAAGQLIRSGVKARFLLCGLGMTWENRRLVDWIEAEGLRDSFYLLGPRSDVPKVMAALDLSTSSSLSEGFPNVIGEAMAAEVPCVVTDVGESRKLVGDTGDVVPPRDPSALAAGWKRLIDEGRSGRLDRGRRARQRIEQMFSIEAVARSYERLYDEILAGSAHRSGT